MIVIIVIISKAHWGAWNRLPTSRYRYRGVDLTPVAPLPPLCTAQRCTPLSATPSRTGNRFATGSPEEEKQEAA